MKRKMIRLARAGKWGGRGASGSVALGAGGAAADSSARSAAKASAPNPVAQRLSIRRREVKPQSNWSTVGPSSIDGDQFVGSQDRLAESLPGAEAPRTGKWLVGLELPREPVDERRGSCQLGPLRRSAVG